MPEPLSYTPLPASATRVPLLGIPEWYCWYHKQKPLPEAAPDDVEQCVDVHVERGFDGIVWNCGRSVLDYYSELPNVTRSGAHADPAGGPGAYIARTMANGCPLRRAMARAREHGLALLGRLAMNRHYDPATGRHNTSDFAVDHPEYREVARNGGAVSHKLCYAIPEVRQERMDILLELQRIGVDALVLDLCRQSPILMYHDAIVQPFIREHGTDPREIESDRPEDHMAWFRYRADILTGFMRDLRAAVRDQENVLGRACPIVARVPDNTEWVILALGLDVERWLAEDLIDATMLSPFPLVDIAPERCPEHHVRIAHAHGKACFGGIGSLNLIPGDGPQPHIPPESYFDPRPMYELADRLHRAGVDAMTVYQTETVGRMPHLAEYLPELGDRARVAERCTTLPPSRFPAEYPIALDWHAKHDGSLGVRRKAFHQLGAGGQRAL